MFAGGKQWATREADRIHASCAPPELDPTQKLEPKATAEIARRTVVLTNVWKHFARHKILLSKWNWIYFTGTKMRTRWLKRSVIKIIPSELMARLSGPFKFASIASPPSPPAPGSPVPAIVSIVPSGRTRRTFPPRGLTPSAFDVKIKEPNASNANPNGPLMLAEVAGPPSPVDPALPLPATVAMIPSGEIRRMRRLPESQTYRFPFGSSARLPGPLSDAFSAGPPSPENPGMPVPATVLTVPSAAIFRIRCPVGSET